MAKESVGRLKQLHAEAQEALDDASLARREEHELTRLQTFLHFWGLVVRSFIRNRCPIRASSLAYASLLAMVPMLALVIGVSSSLLKRQGEDTIRSFVTNLVASVTPEAGTLPARPAPRVADPAAPALAPADDAVVKAKMAAETREEITKRIMEFVGNIRSGTLNTAGVIALLVVAISMLARIEDTFNDIWGVTRGRRWGLRIFLYWGAITLGPVLWAAAVALTSGSYLQMVRDFMDRLGPAGAWATKFALGVLPYLIFIVAFSVVYRIIPNTQVQWRAAAAGGVVAGCAWQLNQEFSVLYVSRVVSNTSIYGSLGAIPVFMIGLYVSWLILLFGAQVAYAFQNRRTYLQERQVESLNQRSREFVALRLMTALGQSFHRGQKPPSLVALAEGVGVPSRLANQVLGVLQSCGLVVEVAGAVPAYAPARPLDRITVREILLALRAGTGRELATSAGTERELVRSEFTRVVEAEQAAAGTTLEALVNRLPAADSTGRAEGG